jgi:hypothetical protein
MPNDSDSDDFNSKARTSRQLLPTFSNAKDWDKWKFKAQTKLNAKNLWYVLEEEPPVNSIQIDKSPDELQAEQSAVEFTAVAIDAAALVVEQAAAAAAQPPRQVVPPPPAPRPAVLLQRLESPHELAKRIRKHRTHSAKVYEALVESTDGEPLDIVQDITFGDGIAAWKGLMDRYNKVTISSQLATISELLELKMASGTSISRHVTNFKNVLRKVGEQNVKLDEAIYIVTFLKTLPEQYASFRTIIMLKDSLNLTDLFNTCIEHAKTNFPTDEANNEGVALDATELCRFGMACRKHLGTEYGTCNRRHVPGQLPSPIRFGGKGKGKGKGNGKGGGKGGPAKDWTCSACSVSNWGTRAECFKCKAPRYSKREANSKRTADDAALIATLKKKVAKRTKRVKDLRKTLGIEDYDAELSDMALELNMDEGHAALSDDTTIIFKVDSGASSHFGGKGCPLTKMKQCNKLIGTANGDDIHVKHSGTFNGDTIGSNSTSMSFEVQQDDKFARHLFSVKKATESGCRVVFEKDVAYLEHTDSGTIVPLENTPNGWELHFVPEEALDILDDHN